jgi:hypothetical protein
VQPVSRDLGTDRALRKKDANFESVVTSIDQSLIHKKAAVAKPESRKKQRYEEVNATNKNNVFKNMDEEWA